MFRANLQRWSYHRLEVGRHAPNAVILDRVRERSDRSVSGIHSGTLVTPGPLQTWVA